MVASCSAPGIATWSRLRVLEDERDAWREPTQTPRTPSPAAAYGAEVGVSAAAYMRQPFPYRLDPDGVARAIVAIVSEEDHRESTVFDLTAAGLVPAS